MAAVIARPPSAQDAEESRLKGELQVLRRKGALRSQDCDEASDDGRACARCRAELGRIINRGAFCRACRLRVCKACREYSSRTTEWVCCVCHKNVELQTVSGEWMNEYVRKPSRRRGNRVYIPPADVIKRSIRRSWTISNPSPRWSSLRGSAELRAYSSLPRHQDHPPGRPILAANPDPSSPVPKRREPRRLPSVESTDSGAPPSPASCKADPSRRAAAPATPRQLAPPINWGSNESIKENLQQGVRLRSIIGYQERARGSHENLTSDEGSFERRSLIPVATRHGGHDLEGKMNRGEMTTQQRRSVFVNRDSDRSSGIGSDGSFQGSTHDSDREKGRQGALSPLRRNEVFSYQRRSLINDGINRNSEELRQEAPGYQRHVGFINDGLRQESPSFQRRSLISEGISRNSEEMREDSPSFVRRSFISEGIGRNSEESPNFPRRSLITEGINRNSEEMRQESPNFPRRSLITEGINRNSEEMRQESPYLQRRSVVGDGVSRQRRAMLNRGGGGGGSGTSDSGGELNQARKREEVVAGCGDEVEATTGAVFRRVTVKRRRQDTRRVLEGGSRSRRTRLTESLRVTEVSRHLDDPATVPDHLLATDGDDYQLVFISSDSSSKEEEFSHSDDADADSSSTSSTASTPGFTVDDCDWDYFESASMARPVLRDWNWHRRRASPSVLESGQSTAEDSPIPPRRLLYSTRKRDSELDSDNPSSPKFAKRMDSSLETEPETGSFLARRSLPSSKSSSEWSVLEDPSQGGSYLDAGTPRPSRHTIVRPDPDRSTHERSLDEVTCSPQYYRAPPTGVADSPAAERSPCFSQTTSLEQSGRQVACCSCGATSSSAANQNTPVVVPIPVPIPVPVPAALWPLQQDATLADIVYSAERDNNGSIRIRIRSLRSANAPWCLVPVQVREPGGETGPSKGEDAGRTPQIVYEIVNEQEGGNVTGNVSLEMMMVEDSKTLTERIRGEAAARQGAETTERLADGVNLAMITRTGNDTAARPVSPATGDKQEVPVLLHHEDDVTDAPVVLVKCTPIDQIERDAAVDSVALLDEYLPRERLSSGSSSASDGSSDEGDGVERTYDFDNEEVAAGSDSSNVEEDGEEGTSSECTTDEEDNAGFSEVFVINESEDEETEVTKLLGDVAEEVGDDDADGVVLLKHVIQGEVAVDEAVLEDAGYSSSEASLERLNLLTDKPVDNARDKTLDSLAEENAVVAGAEVDKNYSANNAPLVPIPVEASLQDKAVPSDSTKSENSRELKDSDPAEHEKVNTDVIDAPEVPEERAPISNSTESTSEPTKASITEFSSIPGKLEVDSTCSSTTADPEVCKEQTSGIATSAEECIVASLDSATSESSPDRDDTVVEQMPIVVKQPTSSNSAQPPVGPDTVTSPNSGKHGSGVVKQVSCDVKPTLSVSFSNEVTVIPASSELPQEIKAIVFEGESTVLDSPVGAGDGDASGLSTPEHEDAVPVQEGPEETEAGHTDACPEDKDVNTDQVDSATVEEDEKCPEAVPEDSENVNSVEIESVTEIGDVKRPEVAPEGTETRAQECPEVNPVDTKTVVEKCPGNVDVNTTGKLESVTVFEDVKCPEVIQSVSSVGCASVDAIHLTPEVLDSVKAIDDNQCVEQCPENTDVNTGKVASVIEVVKYPEGISEDRKIEDEKCPEVSPEDCETGIENLPAKVSDVVEPIDLIPENVDSVLANDVEVCPEAPKSALECPEPVTEGLASAGDANSDKVDSVMENDPAGICYDSAVTDLELATSRCHDSRPAPVVLDTSAAEGVRTPVDVDRSPPPPQLDGASVAAVPGESKHQHAELSVASETLCGADVSVEEGENQQRVEPEVGGRKGRKKKNLARRNSKEAKKEAEVEESVVEVVEVGKKGKKGKKGEGDWAKGKKECEGSGEGKKGTKKPVKQVEVEVIAVDLNESVESVEKYGSKKAAKKKKRFGKWGNKKKAAKEAEPVVTSPVHEVCSEILSQPPPDRDAATDCSPAEELPAPPLPPPPSPQPPPAEDADNVLYFGEERDSSSDEEEDAGYRNLPSFVGEDRVIPESRESKQEHKYTSLVMITQDAPTYEMGIPGSVSVVTSETTTLVNDDVIVRHTNWQDEDVVDKSLTGGLAGYFTLTLENSGRTHVARRPLVTKTKRVEEEDDVVVVTGGDTMSAVVCLEDGMADDDSWVEEMDEREGEEEFATTTPTEDSSSGDDTPTTPMTVYGDREEELRGYHRSAIDFTLHTIVEESCEESEPEVDRGRKSASELEKYFFFGLGGGDGGRELDSFSECSSIYSEGLESMGGEEVGGDGEEGTIAEELASSRLEKYFLSGFMGFAGDNRDSDGSGSVGSDSEGRPSPEQRRKRLVRARGTGRQHSNSNSLDNLTAVTEAEMNSPNPQDNSESSSTETDEMVASGFEKTDGAFDTVKRKKKKHRSTPEVPAETSLEGEEGHHGEEMVQLSDSDERNETPQPELPADLALNRAKQQSRDSGFIGSCDDLLKEPAVTSDTPSTTPETRSPPTPSQCPPQVSLTRKDSFNNWSSDEETNLMMSKMRAFFKTMVATATPPSPLTSRPVPTPNAAPAPGQKPPQLVYFENELTRLMKTVPGIRDEQVREIVEYLSSEDTWSDSYDSSDYTSSDLEGAVAYYQQTNAQRTELQEQISASCQQIINKFDTSIEDDDALAANKDTALVYQRLVASFSKMASGGGGVGVESDATTSSSPHSSPPLLAKVMHHIGSRLVALMHEVSSPKIRPRRTSSASTTTTDEDDDLLLPRSQSHDLLLARPGLRSSSSGVSDQDERFSWRGSFESALLAADSRTKLSAAKRRSAGDLASSNKNSREQLDRVRSCGSIGVEEKIWGRRRSSVPDAGTSGASNDGDEDEDDNEDDLRSVTLPRSLQTSCGGTNSLPRLPTSTASAVMHFNKGSGGGVKSARYRPPGYGARVTQPKRAVSAPGLHQRRRTRGPQASSVAVEDTSISEEAPPTPPEEDIDRLVMIHQQRASLSSLGPRSDSMASVYSGAGESRYGTVAVRGEVEFALSYNYKAAGLEITVKQCRDLAAVDAKRNRSDPYVKVYLLPDKSKSGKRKTKVKKHTLNPVFEETLKFNVSLDSLESRTLWLTVWHSDMFGRNDFLGEVMMSLENKVFDDPSPHFYPLNERTEPFEDLTVYKGDIIIGLKFVPPDVTVAKKGKRSRGALHVLVKEAKNLTAVKAVGSSDPFCKCYLLPDKGRSSKQKTPVVRRNCSPAWNYTFVYDDVTLQELSERCLELTVWDHDRLASNEFLGGLRFSLGSGKHYGKLVDWMDASGKELQLWQSMLERPNFWVEGSIALRSSLELRIAPS